jgi:hypothetical protein
LGFACFVVPAIRHFLPMLAFELIGIAAHKFGNCLHSVPANLTASRTRQQTRNDEYEANYGCVKGAHCCRPTLPSAARHKLVRVYHLDDVAVGLAKEEAFVWGRADRGDDVRLALS